MFAAIMARLGQLSTTARRRLIALALLAGGAAFIFRRRALKAAAAKKRRQGDGDGKPKKRRQDPMAQIIKLLWPFGKSKKQLSTDPDGKAGQLELLAIFAVSVLRTWHSNRMVFVKRNLMAATYSRDVAAFKGVISETVILSFLSSLIFATHRYLKERLALVWREKLTRKLHRQYFHAMNYYKISHLNESKIADVEERITRDPRRFCKALADEMEKLSAALTSGVWFTYKLTTISSLPYAMSPLAYFFAAYQIVIQFVPNWSERWRIMLDRRGQYFNTQIRLQSHSEAVCAYQGNAQERSIIEGYWNRFITYCKGYVQDASVFQFVSSALFEYGGHSFAEALIVGRFIPESNPTKMAIKAKAASKSAGNQVKMNAALFSEVRFVTEYFVRAMSAQGSILGVMRQLQNMRGPGKRMTELLDTLNDFEQIREESTTFVDNNDRIAFENIQVYTPTGHLLVKDLNFAFDSGTNMLLTGCNGSGKSSIFRCLGALWKVKDGGTITKPGGGKAGLNSAVFYLPQKPYNVIGTLRDQLCYPESKTKAAAITEDMLAELLAEVDLSYLLDRGYGKLDAPEVDWEKILSLGEKQRLAMARLFYHKPKFAILDECTSGVSATMERQLYETCARRKITCVTISHRPVLEQYHDVVLNILADGKGGYTWRETGRDKNAELQLLGKRQVVSNKGKFTSSYTGDTNRDGELERQRLKDRSAKYEHMALKRNDKDKVEMPKVATSKRLRDVMKRLMPHGASPRDKEFWRILCLAGIVVFKTLAADMIAQYDGFIVTLALTSDWRLFAKTVAATSFFRTFLAFFDAAMTRQKWYLNLEWRKRLTSYMMDLYFKGNTFYDIKNHDARIADPEDRLTEQIETLSVSLTDLWTNLFKPAFDIGYNSVMLYRTLGAAGVTYSSGYMLLGLLIMRLVVPNFRALTRKQFDLESRFRAVHNRLIDHTESVAFFGGDEVEHEIVEERFQQLGKHVEVIAGDTLRFNILNNFTIRQTPDIIAFALRMFYSMQAFKSDSDVMKAAGGGKISTMGVYIEQTVMRSFKSFGDAFELQEAIGNFLGVLENVTDTMYVLEELAAKQQQQVASGNLMPSSDGTLSFKGVDIVAPSGMCVASNLSFNVKPNQPLIVTGPNACGKSSLFRTMGGLWPIPCGSIERPCNELSVVTPKHVFLVPQKPYSVMGTLADQITYPEKISKAERSAADEAKLLSLLSLVRVDYLVEREGGWDVVRKWEDVLSLGEQQRIGCARLFYHAPRFAILDECTSAVSIDVEEELYKQAKEHGITSITISQRLALEEFHTHELAMGDADSKDGWKLRELSDSREL